MFGSMNQFLIVCVKNFNKLLHNMNTCMHDIGSLEIYTRKQPVLKQNVSKYLLSQDLYR